MPRGTLPPISESLPLASLPAPHRSSRRSIAQRSVLPSVQHSALFPLPDSLPFVPIPVSRMAQYVNFSSVHSRLRKQAWCSFDEFRTFVTDFQHVGFYIHANRVRVGEAFARLRERSDLFSASTRFPDDDYVHLDSEFMNAWFTQLMNAVDLPNRMIEKGTSGDTGLMSLNDAKRSFDVAFQKLASVLRLTTDAALATHGVYSRTSFETTFALNWQ